MASDMTLQVQAETLQRQIRHHKSAIRQHRDALSAAKAQLTTLEEDCRRIGIRLVLVPIKPQAKG